MQVDITPKQHGVEVDTEQGVFYVAADVLFWKAKGRLNDSVDPEKLKMLVKPYIPSVKTIVSIEVVHGYFGRLSAPGYMDATDWEFDTNFRRLERRLKKELRGDD